jgi:hypothetical protein
MDPLHLDDAAIETMVRNLIQEHLADDAREAALNWLEKRVGVYLAVQDLGLLNPRNFSQDHLFRR